MCVTSGERNVFDYDWEKKKAIEAGPLQNFGIFPEHVAKDHSNIDLTFMNIFICQPKFHRFYLFRLDFQAVRLSHSTETVGSLEKFLTNRIMNYIRHMTRRYLLPGSEQNNGSNLPNRITMTNSSHSHS